jgi:SAM-dependent methyltransferase
MYEREAVKIHFENIAQSYDFWKKKNKYYYSLIKKFFNKNIPAGSKVVEFGCATGDVLAACKPKVALGIDFSLSLLEIARNKYPDYEFKLANVEKFVSPEKFEYCIMSDLIDHLSDIPQTLGSAYGVLGEGAKLLITTINPLWGPALDLFEKFRQKMPEGPHSFIPNRFIEFFCKTKGFRIVSKGALIFIPLRIPFISDILNSIVPRLPVLSRFCWVQTLIAQKETRPITKLSYSVIIPAYNEEKNIEQCIDRVPKSDRDCEIIVIDDGSTDATSLIVKKMQRNLNRLKLIVFPENRGKAAAIEEGIRLAGKDVVIILDADMAVAPEDIVLFIEPLETQTAQFVNGTRLVYNMEKNAMEQLKRIANFSLALFLSCIFKTSITDTLCGTKAFFRKDFQAIKMSGERWGDLVLLWTAKIKGLKIEEVPVRYYSRKSGNSKMRLFYDGSRFMFYILKMSLREFLNFKK